MISFLISREQLSKWVMGERSWWSPLVRNHPVLRPAAHKVTQIREVSTNQFWNSFLQKKNQWISNLLPTIPSVVDCPKILGSQRPFILLWPQRLNCHLLRPDLLGTNYWISITCSLLFLGHIGIQVRRNIQPHWYRGAQKYSATLVSRCAEIFRHIIGIENMSSHATSPQLFWSVLTGGAWSEEKLENCQSRYCGFSPLKGQGSKQLSKQMQPGPETKHTIWTHHTAGQGSNPSKGTAIH